MALGPYPIYRPPSMPPNMITRESSIGTELVTFPEGKVIRYYLFTTVYNTRDVYCFVSQDALDGLPTTRLGMHKIADLCVYCEDWGIAVKNRGDDELLGTVIEAFRDLLTVEEVHAL